MLKITPQKIKEMSYVELMAFLGEVNRPPGGKDSIRRVVQNCFINKDSKILDIGCNTGYCSLEIAHLAHCRVTGIDVSPQMIKTAEKFRRRNPLGDLIDFKVGDATNLFFSDEKFDMVISGGSTAFMDNKKKALLESKRVLKYWGFFVDINFYYQIKPPVRIIKGLNDLMNVNIRPWSMDYWLDLYKKTNLEKYFVYTNNIKARSRREVKDYCIQITALKGLSKGVQKILIERLTSIMNLFNENHKYLAYGIFVLRKRPTVEQVSLFGA